MKTIKFEPCSSIRVCDSCQRNKYISLFVQDGNQCGCAPTRTLEGSRHVWTCSGPSRGSSLVLRAPTWYQLSSSPSSCASRFFKVANENQCWSSSHQLFLLRTSWSCYLHTTIFTYYRSVLAPSHIGENKENKKLHMNLEYFKTKSW